MESVDTNAGMNLVSSRNVEIASGKDRDVVVRSGGAIDLMATGTMFLGGQSVSMTTSWNNDMYVVPLCGAVVVDGLAMSGGDISSTDARSGLTMRSAGRLEVGTGADKEGHCPLAVQQAVAMSVAATTALATAGLRSTMMERSAL